MLDAILNHLRDSDGASSVDLASRILKFKNPEPSLAHRAITGILGKDRRCFFDNDGLWRASPIAAAPAGPELSALPWRAVQVLTGDQANRRKIFHVSVWTVLPSPTPAFGEWLESPAALSFDERSVLVSGGDTPFNENRKDEILSAIAQQCIDGVPVFLSGRHFAVLKYNAAMSGVALPEDAFLVSHLFSAAHVPFPKPITLSGCYAALFNRAPVLTNARGHGEALAHCVAELIERLAQNGVATMAELEAALNAAVESFDFSQKGFSYNDLINLPQQPGVYAFTAKNGAFLYIGKASNLRRRIMGYFRQTDESPEKLERLRAEAHCLTTHVCGSELESLIYEFRLIKKHAPLLNVKTDVNERKGDFKPIHDCIILLPHADEGKGMSFWFRRNQKISLKPFNVDFQQSGEMVEELERFFFSDKLPAQPTDFPEQEIALRWMKCHAEELVVVPVSRLQNAREIYAALRDYWDEVKISG
jgi:hypothetical protein